MLVEYIFFSDILIWRKRIGMMALKQDMSVLIPFLFLGLLFGFQDCMKNLIEDAADGPHVRGLVILVFNKRDFRWTIPSWAYMSSERPLLGSLLVAVFLELFGDGFVYLWGIFRFLEIFLADGVSQSASISGTFSKKALWQSSSYTKITNFDLAVAIDQNISGL